MSTRVELAVAIPQTFPSGRVEPARVREYVTRAEALGFSSAWVGDQTLGRIPSLEPLAALAWIAACTTRLRLGSAVLLSGLRSPIHLAKSLATLDHLSGGRLIVGVGLGNPKVYSVFGLPPDRRAARFTEGLRLMKALWTESRVSFAGEFFKLEHATMEPKPLQRPHPPLWFGAHHPNALRRAVELGDGFMGAGSATTAQFTEEVKILRGLLAAAGRDPATFGVGKRVYVAIDRDRARAGARLTEWFGAYYGRPELASEVSVWGDIETCLEGLQRVIAGGARLVMLHPVFDELAHLETFAADLVPKLAAA